MTGPATRCRQSTIVHSNCDKCGLRPEVIHKPVDTHGSRYCEDCCPACKGKSQKASP